MAASRDSRPFRASNRPAARHRVILGRDRSGLATENGFSLVELLVASGIAAIVIAGAFLIFDVNSRVSRTQIQVSDLQQSQRIAQQELLRFTRMAGRGGLPQGWGVSVRDNVPDGFQIAGNDVVVGSDVLTVRGIFSSPVLHVSSVGGGGGFAWNPGGLNGSLVVDSRTRAGIRQPIDAIADAIANNRPDPLLIISTNDPAVYAIVEITGGAVAGADLNGDGITDPDEQRATVTFSANPLGSTQEAGYTGMSQGGGFPPGLRSAAYVGVLEEFHFYVRDTSAVGGDEPKLSRAQLFPNTALVYDGNAANGRVDIADNVSDLQIAVAFDANNDGRIDELSAPAADEWLFNDANDVDTDSIWGALDADLPWTVGNLFQLRLTTLVRTDRPDPGFQDDPIPALENRTYSDADINSVFERSFRRRVMQTLVDLRNLGAAPPPAAGP